MGMHAPSLIVTTLDLEQAWSPRVAGLLYRLVLVKYFDKLIEDSNLVSFRTMEMLNYYTNYLCKLESTNDQLPTSAAS